MKKLSKIVAIVCVVLMFAASSVFAASTVLIEETGQAGRVTWEQGVVEAIGTGVPPANAISVAQAKVLARRAAIVDAYRNLAETIDGVQVDAETTLANLQISSDIVKTKVSGLIKGAKIIREQAMPDGSYQVVMAVNLYGSDGIAGAVLPATRDVQAFPAPSPEYIRSNGNFAYTGVVIDGRGLDLQATFSPGIEDVNGRSIYGSVNIDPNFAISKGMVDYAPTSELVQEAENGQSRAGARPLIIKAVSLTRNNCNVVISKEDGDKILAANRDGHFLEKCAVVFEK
ncbi:MAG: LPP20 family lipoprotein [Pelosinus sp.]|nr:LPP20 family lipoprotein [Pelosinus sp.]